MERKLKLSPTSLQRWYELGCPAKWNFDWQWKRIGTDEKFLEVGSQVHSLMESGPDGWSEYPETAKFYEKMQGILYSSGITLTGPKERKFSWELEEGVTWSIKIDDFGTMDDGTRVIVDYKTAWGKGWKQTPSGSVPQALAFQGPAYLMAPPDIPPELTPWPSTMIYLVAPLWGAGQMFRFDWDSLMEENLMDAIHGAVAVMKTDRFPRVLGKQCIECPFQPKCYGEDGESELYVSRFAKDNDGRTGSPGPKEPQDAIEAVGSEGSEV